MKSGFYKVVILLLTGLIIYSCEHSTEAGKKDPQFKVTFADVSCTEAWLDVSFSDSTQRNLELKFAETGRTVTRTLAAGTTLYIDSLQPNTSYNLAATLPETNDYTTKTENVTFTTLDTTSHDFTWEKFTFGEVGTSILYDVAVIDENNIWAVGEIYLRDSTGQADPHPYNAVHWDGKNWKLKRIYYLGGFAPMTAIYAFNENDIWYGIGYLIHWDGQDYKEIEIPDWHIRINKIWGTSSKDIYIAGNNGNIAYYDGHQWKRINTETRENIVDIYGAKSKFGNSTEIIAVAGNEQTAKGEILIYKDGEFKKLSYNGMDNRGSFASVWFKPGTKLIVSGGHGHFVTNNVENVLWEDWIPEEDNQNYYLYDMDASDYNDIFAVGGYGALTHYNGTTFKHFISETYMRGNFYAIDNRNNLVIAVGIESNKAIILVGKR